MQSRVQHPLETRFHGQPVGPGLGIGPVYEATEPELAVTHRRIAVADVPAETARLEEALTRSRHQLGKLKARPSGLPEHSQAELEPLIDAYLHMLGPSRLISGIKRRIKEGLANAEAAVSDETDAQAGAILALTGSDHAGRQRRAEEVREISRRIRAQPRAPALPQFPRSRPRQHPGRARAAPLRRRADPHPARSPASSPPRAARTAIPP